MNTRTQQLVLNVAKVTVILLLVFFVWHVYASTDRNSETSIEDMKKAVLQGKTPEGTEQMDQLKFRQIFGVDDSGLDGVIYYGPASNMDSSELLIVKMDADASKTSEELMTAIESRISAQKAVFEGYAPDQYGLLNDAIAVKKGNYVFYAASEQADEYYNRFIKAL